MKKHNFSAGPSILSPYTIKHTAEGILDLDQSGLSVMEISHRSKEFIAIMDETQQLFKDLLDIPSGYSVLLLQGGASLQFCMVPYNLLQTKAAYLDTGSWASKAAKEAKLFGEVEVVASSKDTTYSYIPKGYVIPSDADYFHITTNNTIYGTEIKEDMDVPMHLVADMSSDIFSRPMDVSKYALIYGGAQKNLAPAGVTFVIVKDEILGKVTRPIPTMLNYQTHIDNGSMFNTPPCVAIYAAMHTLRWYMDQGGLAAMHKLNLEKAGILYDEIDGSPIFTSNIGDVNDRSIMNVTFVMKEEYKEKEADFLAFAGSRGMSGLKGHRSVGGVRASIYNAMPISSVEALVETMKAFEQNL
ncbi:MAG: 3-phosphoserine/phosphohydroxythreonine transaminase [Bacteroidia bacterium]|nr:MAG: 3-phosphoserine/phosphohydroxythreonine transaminase [Bacteroidia bacterium]